jgi:uncharacterized protein YecT (DUF1311 family)
MGRAIMNPVQLAPIAFLFATLLPGQDAKPNGQIAAETSPCDKAKTQQEMNQCSGEEYRKANSQLNGLYSKLVASMQKEIVAAQHKNDASQEKYNTTALEKLRSAERAWIQYRDLHCDAARHLTEGGSVSPLVWANCMTEATRHRIEELKNTYKPEETAPR